MQHPKQGFIFFLLAQYGISAWQIHYLTSAATVSSGQGIRPVWATGREEILFFGGYPVGRRSTQLSLA